MKKLLIRQPAGMGDIFLCLKIAKKYQEKGYEIIWPINDDYMYLNDYLDIDFKFIPISSQFLGKDFITLNVMSIVDSPDLLFLPLEVASFIVGNPIMNAKYRLAGVDIEDYLDYFNFKRDPRRESNLFFNQLDLLDGVSTYRVNNKNFGTYPDVRKFDKSFIDSKENLYNIDMYLGDKKSHIFDWCSTIEKSKEFHTVGTSITFIAEKLNVNNTKLFMYRRTGTSLEQFYDDKKLFKKNWTFIE